MRRFIPNSGALLRWTSCRYLRISASKSALHGIPILGETCKQRALQSFLKAISVVIVTAELLQTVFQALACAVAAAHNIVHDGELIHVAFQQPVHLGLKFFQL